MPIVQWRSLFVILLLALTSSGQTDEIEDDDGIVIVVQDIQTHSCNTKYVDVREFYRGTISCVPRSCEQARGQKYSATSDCYLAHPLPDGVCKLRTVFDINPHTEQSVVEKRFHFQNNVCVHKHAHYSFRHTWVHEGVLVWQNLCNHNCSKCDAPMIPVRRGYRGSHEVHSYDNVSPIVFLKPHVYDNAKERFENMVSRRQKWRPVRYECPRTGWFIMNVEVFWIYLVVCLFEMLHRVKLSWEDPIRTLDEFYEHVVTKVYAHDTLLARVTRSPLKSTLPRSRRQR